MDLARAEDFEEAVFEGGAGLAEELGCELKDAAGVGDDLDGLDAGDLVEEPAAAGVHELGVALQLQEFEDGDALLGGERMGGVLGEEAVLGVGGAVEDDVDVGVAGGPEVVEQRCGEGFGERSGGVAQEVEGLAQGGAPLLVPAGLAAVAAAVGAPALDAVDAGPGGVLGDLGLPLGRELREELAVVGEVGVAVVLDPVHGVGEGHLAVLVMVAVTFAVGGDVGELGFAAGVGGVWAEAVKQAAAEGFAGVEQALKGDGAGGGAVVEEDGDGAAFVELDAVGAGGVDGGVGSFGPGVAAGFGGFGGFGGQQCFASVGGLREVADAGALVGREDGEQDALGAIRSRTLRLTAVSASHMPSGLRPKRGSKSAMPQRIWVRASRAAGERHDDVVVDLRDGGAVAAVALGAGDVGVEDAAIGAGSFVGEPVEQGGAEVEAHARVVVDDADDLVLAIDDARGAVGGVALGGDALVPVVVGRGGVLDLDGLEPGILARRLVEVAVHADVTVDGRSGGLRGFRRGTC